MSESTNRQKYETGNPVVRWLLGRFLKQVVSQVSLREPARILDLGCGEGWVAEQLMRRLPNVSYRGVEIDDDAVREASARLPQGTFSQGDIREPQVEPGWADVTLCLEVLEHLAAPEPAVRRIAEQTARDGLALVSVPWEPFFRGGNLLRGKYLEHFGNHPEHVQQFGPLSFRRLLATRFERVRVTPQFPWLIALAERPR